MNAHHFDLSVRTLIYKEDDQYAAHALEMDIVAYGETEEKARKGLCSLIENQISFASCKGTPDMVYFKAPQDFFDRWETAHEAAIKGKILADKSVKLAAKAIVIKFTHAEIKKLRQSRRKDFSKTEGLVVA